MTAPVVDLAGRTALVTGAGRGIGAEIARALAAAGARVCVTGRNEGALAVLAAELGGGAVAMRCDVTSPDDVGRLADRLHADMGAPHIVINNAGVARSAKFADTDEAMWAEHLEVNLTGAYRVSRAFWPDLVAAGPTAGRLIFIASTAAKVGFLYTTAYCASKHGLLGLARALALESGGRGPTVNCVCPGWVDTDMAHDAIQRIMKTTGRSEADARKELEKMNPQRRLMTAEEVAQVTLFLCGDAARGVTGQAWNVDGGQVMT